MKRLVRSVACCAFFGVLALASTSGPVAPTAVHCDAGLATGVFEVADFNQDGEIFGTLSLGASGVVAYVIDGDLNFVPTPCLSCIEGAIDATLDDGVGSGPDYRVVGRYIGNWFGGEGHFEASVYPVGSTTRVGRIRGTFQDPPGSTQPGHFDATWRICD